MLFNIVWILYSLQNKDKTKKKMSKVFLFTLDSNLRQARENKNSSKADAEYTVWGGVCIPSWSWESICVPMS